MTKISLSVKNMNYSQLQERLCKCLKMLEGRGAGLITAPAISHEISCIKIRMARFEKQFKNEIKRFYSVD